MKELQIEDLAVVSGGGAWDDFWKSVGDAWGEFIGEQAYSESSRNLYELGSNGGLDGFLENQNDPLL